MDYRVSANPDTVTRKAAIAVNGQRAEILQAAGACQFTVAPLSHAVGAAGATGSVGITAAAELFLERGDHDKLDHNHFRRDVAAAAVR